MAPSVQTYVSDDREEARNRMRPMLALYIGGMGSRKQNFYNQLVQRYGFEDAARKIQDLYLDGKKDEAAAALPDELIDLVTLCGPKDHVRDRLAAFRGAGVGTLTISAMAFTARGADRAAAGGRRAGGLTPPGGRLRFFLGAFGEPGHAFPMLALGAQLAARGHEVTYETWSRWREHVEAAGMRFVPAPEYQLFPEPGARFEMYEAVVRATGPTRRAVAELRPDAVVHDILTLAPAMAGELEGIPVATLIPHLYPAAARGLPAVRDRRSAAADGAWPRFVGSARPALASWAAARPSGSERRPGAARTATGGAAPRRAQRAPVHGRDVPSARVSALLASRRARRRAADVGAAVR